MDEHEAILKDLQKYMKKIGIRTEVDALAGFSRLCVIGLNYCFAIYDNQICLFYSKKPIVSLADPKYREKFKKHLRGKYDR